MKIMAPAGDYDRLIAAIKGGADEVYLGLAGYGARRYAKNFELEECVAAVELAHKSNVAVHLTLNTLTSDEELDRLYPDVKRLYEAGLDAAIVQDFGVASWAREFFPELALSASTQLSPGTARELNWHARNGFKRAVLARELSLDEIAAICRATAIEVEVFVSGALCLGASGKCYLSSFIGGRSGNRGMCAQPCRRPYDAEALRADAAADAIGSGCFLSLKDQLLGRDELRALLDAGVASVKIEGRMKSPPYVLATTRYYRDLLDSIMETPIETSLARLSVKKSEDGASDTRSRPTTAEADAERRAEIEALFNRGYAKGFNWEHDPEIVNATFSANFGVEIGRVRRDAARLAAPLRNGDGVVFLDSKLNKLGGLYVNGLLIVDPTNTKRARPADAAQPGDLVRFRDPIPDGAAILYRTFDHALNKRLENELKQTRRREPIAARLVAKVGENMRLTLATDRAEATATSDAPLARAQKRGADRDSLRAALDRFGESPFFLDAFDLEFDRDAFVPKSTINQLRQTCSEELERKIVESYRRKAPERRRDEERPALRLDSYRDARDAALRDPARTPNARRDPARATNYHSALVAIVRTQTQFEACRDFGVKTIHCESQPVQYEGRTRFQASDVFAPLAGAPEEALRFEELGVEYALDWFFNVGSARAVRALVDALPRARSICLSPEISDRAVAELAARLRDLPPSRRVALALPIYGRLLALRAQKTLFDESRVRIADTENRRALVEKLADLAADAPGVWVDAAGREASAPTGSVVRLLEPLDLLDAIPQIVVSGVDELRLYFTNEKYAETTRVLERAARGGSGGYHTFSYGYTRDGVF